MIDNLQYWQKITKKSLQPLHSIKPYFYQEFHQTINMHTQVIGEISQTIFILCVCPLLVSPQNRVPSSGEPSKPCALLQSCALLWCALKSMCPPLAVCPPLVHPPPVFPPSLCVLLLPWSSLPSSHAPLHSRATLHSVCSYEVHDSVVFDFVLCVHCYVVVFYYYYLYIIYIIYILYNI